MKLWLLFFAAAFLLPGLAQAEESEKIGEISTEFKLLGPNHKIIVEAIEDPKVSGVVCYLSRPKTGGISGGLGLAEDKAYASIDCVRDGRVQIKEPFKPGETVFDIKTSLVFKELRVVRFYDAKRHTLIYLTYSTRVIDGSYKNAVSAITVDE
jgi:CreA protein